MDRNANDLGLSLWLVPPNNIELHDALATVIARGVPAAIGNSEPSPRFKPHLTLTSHIPKSSTSDDPQKWLDDIKFPEVTRVEVDFQELTIGEAFFKRLFIRCTRTESLLQLASACRALSIPSGDQLEYDPHVSLLYSAEPVSEEARRSIEDMLAEKNILIEGHGGWKGGEVWLVPTDKDVADWNSIARRSLAK